MSIFTPASSALLYPVFKFHIEQNQPCIRFDGENYVERKDGTKGVFSAFLGNNSIIEKQFVPSLLHPGGRLNFGETDMFDCEKFAAFIEFVRTSATGSNGYTFDTLDGLDEFVYDANCKTFRMNIAHHGANLSVTIPLVDVAADNSALFEANRAQLCEELTKLLDWARNLN